MKRYLPVGILIFVLLVTLVGAGLLFRSKRPRQQFLTRTDVGKPGAEPPHQRGPAVAPVTLEEFGDFECPPCGNLSPILEKLKNDYGDQLCLIFRQFPLAAHRHAVLAASASEAAGLQGRFWEMHDLLYRNRFIWPRAADVAASFETYAAELRLDVERFKRDINGQEVKARLASDQERASSLGVNQTPTVFIDGKQVPPTALNPDGLKAAIDSGLCQRPR